MAVGGGVADTAALTSASKSGVGAAIGAEAAVGSGWSDRGIAVGERVGAAAHDIAAKDRIAKSDDTSFVLIESTMRHEPFHRSLQNRQETAPENGAIPKIANRKIC